MRLLKSALVLLVCFIPLSVLADHEEILIPIFAQICSIVIFIVLSFLTRIKKSIKIIMVLTYLSSLLLIVYFTASLPYNQNRKFVDLSWSIGPAVFTIFVYLLLKVIGFKSNI